MASASRTPWHLIPGVHAEAQACYNHCVALRRGDIHKLDRDKDDNPRESLHQASWDSAISFEPVAKRYCGRGERRDVSPAVDRGQPEGETQMGVELSECPHCGLPIEGAPVLCPHCGRKTTTTSMRQRAAALLANPGRYLVAAGAGALMLGALWPWGRLGPPGRWFSWPNGAAIATGTIGLALACIARLHQGSPGKAYSPISVVLSIAAMLIGGPFLLQVIRLANRDPLITFSRGGYTTAAGIVLILVGGLLRTRAENGSSNARRAEVDPADAAEQVMDG